MLGVGALIYYSLLGYMRVLRKQEMIALRAAQGQCIHCGEPANPDSGVCENCGEYYLDSLVAQEVYQRAEGAVARNAEVEILRYAA